ncbi:MAG: Flp pilus assembly protein TadD [Polaribacter sp.]
MVLSLTNRHSDAVDILNTVIIESPKDPVVRHNLALALFKTGDIDSAIEHYQIALRLNPNQADGV